MTTSNFCKWNENPSQVCPISASKVLPFILIYSEDHITPSVQAPPFTQALIQSYAENILQKCGISELENMC